DRLHRGALARLARRGAPPPGAAPCRCSSLFRAPRAACVGGARPCVARSALLLPALLIRGFLAFLVGPWIEAGVFGGDVKAWLTTALGLVYDQRNSIVVGLAMGFAVIPIIFTISEDAFSSVPQHLTAASLALGASRWQT